MPAVIVLRHQSESQEADQVEAALARGHARLLRYPAERHRAPRPLKDFQQTEADFDRLNALARIVHRLCRPVVAHHRDDATSGRNVMRPGNSANNTRPATMIHTNG